MVGADAVGIDLLIVEDDHDDARFVERLIQQQQSTRHTGDRPSLIEVTDIDHVGRLADALDRVRSETPPDVVLLDLMLPDSRGLETVERMVESRPTLPIVVLTGRDEPSIGTEAIRYGAQDYLDKNDISGESVFRALRYAVERTRVRRELADRNHRLAVLNRIVRRDIRNDLSIVVGLGDELRENAAQADVATIETLLDAAHHATNLTDTAADVVDVISTDTVRRAPRDLTAALDAAIERIRDETAAAIALNRDESDARLTVLASPMLESAFVHVLSDAVTRSSRRTPQVIATVETTVDSATVTFTGDVDAVVDVYRSRNTPAEREGRQPVMHVGSYFATTLFESFGGDVRAEADEDGPRLTVALPLASSIHNESGGYPGR